MPFYVGIIIVMLAAKLLFAIVCVYGRDVFFILSNIVLLVSESAPDLRASQTLIASLVLF